MSDKMLKYIKWVGIGAVVFVVCYGVYSLSGFLVSKSYSSGEVVLDNTPDTVDEVVTGEDRVVGDGNMITEYDFNVIPKEVYDEEGIVLRSKEYLGDDYNVYEDMFKAIVAQGDELFDGLSGSTQYVITTEMEEEGFNWYNCLWGTETTDEIKEAVFVELGLDEAGKPSGAEAVYCYEGTRVIYRLNTYDDSFFVVDYSNMEVNKNTSLVEMGKIFGEYLYLVLEECNVTEVEGYTVFSSYNIDVVSEEGIY